MSCIKISLKDVMIKTDVSQNATFQKERKSEK